MNFRPLAIIAILLISLGALPANASTWIAIVDGVSTGNELAPALRAKARALGLDLKLVHVQTYSEYPPFIAPSFHAEDYDRTLVMENERTNLADIVQSLRELHPTFAVAGSESGVTLADELNAELGIQGNPLEYSSLKRNKEDLYSYLFERGIITVPSTGVASVKEGLAWVDRTQVRFPLIAKPTDDAGGHGFRIIPNRAALKSTLKELFSSETMFGEKIARVILQPQLSGSHYAVNGAVYNGEFVFTDVIQYEKDGAVYLNDVLLDSKSPIVQRQIENAKRVLREIRIDYGNFHFEVIDSPEYGIVPIDIAGRAMGGKDHKLVLDCTGYTQILAMVDALLDPAAFAIRRDRAAKGLPAYDYNKAGYVIDLRNNSEGVVSNISGLSLLQKLKTYVESWVKVKVGQTVVKTGNMLEAPGIVMLEGDPKTLQADYKKLRSLEAQNKLITLAPLGDCETAFLGQ